MYFDYKHKNLDENIFNIQIGTRIYFIKRAIFSIIYSRFEKQYSRIFNIIMAHDNEYGKF